jgi:hypothetical protein
LIVPKIAKKKFITTTKVGTSVTNAGWRYITSGFAGTGGIPTDRTQLIDVTKAPYQADNTGDFGQNRYAVRIPGKQTLAFFHLLRIFGHNEYVLARNVQMAVQDGSLVFVTVDNHPARALVDQAAARLPNVCMVCAGNEKVDGNVHVFLRRAGKNLTAPLLARHPEIAKAKAGDRAEMGCEDLISQGETQLLVTNFLAAAACIAAFHTLWTHGERTGRRRNTTNQPLNLMPAMLTTCRPHFKNNLFKTMAAAVGSRKSFATLRGLTNVRAGI